jgi:acetyl esterase/lipase
VSPAATTRRGLLGLAGTFAAGALAGCGTGSRKPAAGTTRHHYGRLADQFGDLSLPSGKPRGTVVLLHGGYWMAGYGLDLMEPIGRALRRDGWAVWNLEYRRLGTGGGYPATFLDTAAGIDHLAELHGVPRDHLVLLGHSAGGQLATWAGSRSGRTPGGAGRVELSGVVSLAGVLDLTRGAHENLGDGAVQQLMGGAPEQVPEHYRLGDPTLLVPSNVPVSALRGRDDDVVPASQLTSYLAAARAAGGDAVGLPVPGDHFTIIDPTRPSWATVLGTLRAMAGQTP